MPEIFSRINKHTLSQPYKADTRQVVEVGQTNVYRPNHNGTHAARKVAYVDSVIDLIEKKGNIDTKKTWRAISPERKQILKLAAYMMRAGRVDEDSGGDNYHIRSAELFKAYARQLSLNDDDISWGG